MCWELRNWGVFKWNFFLKLFLEQLKGIYQKSFAFLTLEQQKNVKIANNKKLKIFLFKHFLYGAP